MVLLPTIGLMIVLAEAAGLSYAAGHVWLVFGLAAGALVAVQSECGQEATKRGSVAPQLGNTSLADGTW
jgi:hypothetical protein